MQQMGVPQEQILAARQKAEQAAKDAEPELTLCPHLVDVVRLFSGLRSQWRTASNGHAGLVFTGLDYAAIEVVQRQMRIEFSNQPRAFEQLRTMEMEALRAMNERT